MFESITWSQYFIAIFICSVVYYLFVWFFYFNAKLPALRLAANSENLLSEKTTNDVRDISAQEVIHKLKPLFYSNYHKRELIQALHVQLKNYRSCETPGFREAINAFIVEESLTTCSIRLGEEDQRAVWM
jgi:hypothetical protein